MARTSTVHWFETDVLVREENLTGLPRLNRELLAQAEAVGSVAVGSLGLFVFSTYESAHLRAAISG